MIVVIGGGWAGCAAAVGLAQAGHPVELHEAAATLGGRARGVHRDGLPLDNGEHLLLGAYVDTLALAAVVHDAPPAWKTVPLSLKPFAPGQARALSLSTAGLPAALALPIAFARAGGLSLGERIATIRWLLRQRRRGWRCKAGTTVAELLAAEPWPVRDLLWDPVCIAALNTPPGCASAQVFLNVLRETFGADARATSIVVPQSGLAGIVPEAAARWLVGHGHGVRRSTRSRITRIDADGVVVDVNGQSMRAVAVVVAVGPHQLASAFTPEIGSTNMAVSHALDAVRRFSYEPITTVYLGYATPLRLGNGLLRLDDRPGQWIFDRGDILDRAAASTARPVMRSLVSVVISTKGPVPRGHGDLAAAVDSQLRRLQPALAGPVWSQVIEEKRATYACVPDLARPACGRLDERIYLAGDYTYAAFPATLEAAVRSGRIAAQALTRSVGATAAAARGSIRAP